MRGRALLVCLVLAAATAGCGGSSSSPPRRTTAAETADPPAAPPRGWTRLDGPSGFTLSLPPGWTVRRSGASGTLIRSADRALAVAVSADRGVEGARQAPSSYLRRTVRDLPGYARLRAGRPSPVPGLRYPTARLTATGTFTRTRVRQAITLYALQRAGRVTYAVSVFRSARTPAARYAPYVGALLRSFRGGPPATR